MTTALAILCCVVVTALFFDFTNGFHDTGNAVASSIATGALAPKQAVALAAAMNLLGAFLSVAVALTVTNSVVRIQDADGAPIPELTENQGEALLFIVLVGLVAGILWNVFTWLLGLPTSSSHALLGGIIGATIAAVGLDGVKWVGDGSKIDGVLGKVVMPAVLSPLIAGIVAMVGTYLVFKISSRTRLGGARAGFRWGQIASASLVSLAHGANDAQKSMGVITLALVAYGTHDPASGTIPFWVKLTCALAIALGTYLGGWRIIRTLSKGLVEISAPQGMAADGASASVILASTHLGFALSTTQVASGAIIGSGIGRAGVTIRWGVAGRMALAWLITVPITGLTAAIMWAIGSGLGGSAGVLVVMVLLIGGVLLMWRRAQETAVDHANVGDEWLGVPDILGNRTFVG